MKGLQSDIKTKPSLIDWAAPLALGVISLAIRLSLVSKGYYQTDCLFLGIQAQKILDTGHMHYLHLLGYPGTALLGALFLGINSILNFNQPALSINLIGVLFSSLSLIPLYFIIKKLFDPLTAFLTTALVMIHPSFLAASVFGNSHMPGLFFFFVSMLNIIRFREQNSLRHLVTGALCAGLMWANRPQEIIHLITIGYLFLGPLNGPFKTRSSLKAFLGFGTIAFITTLVFYIPLILRTFSANNFTHQINEPLSIVRFVTGNLSLYALSVTTPAIIKSFTLGGAILLAAGLFLMIKHTWKLFIFLLFWLIPPLLLYASLVTTLPRYHLNIIIPLCIALGYGLSWFIHHKRHAFILAGIIYGILISILFTSIYPILNFRHQHDLMKEYGAWIRKNTEPSAIIYTQEDAWIIKHFAGRLTKRPPFQEFSQNKNALPEEHLIKMTQESLSSTLRSGIPVYVTSVALFSNDPHYRFKTLLEEHFALKPIAQTVMEEWHQGATNLILYKETLYKIAPR